MLINFICEWLSEAKKESQNLGMELAADRWPLHARVPTAYGLVVANSNPLGDSSELQPSAPEGLDTPAGRRWRAGDHGADGSEAATGGD
jgi:hypothetical protein